MSTFEVPIAVVQETHRHLRAKGRTREEGVVLWCGTFEPPTITRAIVPLQHTGMGRFVVPLAERQRITRQLAGSEEVIVAQVHSHPRAAFHSEVDDEEALPRRVGSYSLVVPHFAARPDLLEEAALFRLEANGTWQPVPLHTFKFAVHRPRWRSLQWLIDTLKSFGPSRT